LKLRLYGSTGFYYDSLYGGTAMKVKCNRKRGKRYNKKQTTKVKVVEILKPEQELAIPCITNLRDKAIIEFLLHTGLRITEYLNLNYGDVFEDIRKKQIKDEISVTGKGNKKRSIPLNENAKQAILNLDSYNRKNLGVKGITKGTPLTISRFGRRISEDTIQAVVNKNLGTNPHVLRHTCLTNMRKEGVKLEVIQKIAGHSDISTTTKYYLSVSNEDLTNAVKAIEKTDKAIKLVKSA
jgi:site-specific recombinase XerD